MSVTPLQAAQAARKYRRQAGCARAAGDHTLADRLERLAEMTQRLAVC